MKKIGTILTICTLVVILILMGCKPAPKKMNEKSTGAYKYPYRPVHSTIFHEAGKFAGWPANNGAWIWDGQEVLVGFTVGPYEIKSGHNLSKPHRSLLARSMDGGQTWESYDPENYIGDGGELMELAAPMDVRHPDFTLRVTGTGYHGNDIPEGGFYFSLDRGRSWSGPYAMKGLEFVLELDSLELSPRTDYLVNDDGSLQVFISARVPEIFGSDRLFCARSEDGGQSFTLQSWVVPREDPYRAVMSSTVRCSGTKLVSSIRRREIGTDRCWVDAYVSVDNGNTWEFLSKVGDTGPENGNPPALLRLQDGRLLCVYGQRERWQIIARISEDEGAVWGPEIIVRDGFWADIHGDADLGYPRTVQLSDGRILTTYYWATEALKEQQIAVTVWDTERMKK
jgi:hypothetical protein